MRPLFAQFGVYEMDTKYPTSGSQIMVEMFSIKKKYTKYFLHKFKQ